jgi:hypothetical protein
MYTAVILKVIFTQGFVEIPDALRRDWKRCASKINFEFGTEHCRARNIQNKLRQV